jgi:hypothetical protein
MKLSAMDVQMLRDAADVADAQQELMEFMKRRSNRTKRHSPFGGQAAATIALSAIAVLSALILSSLA